MQGRTRSYMIRFTEKEYAALRRMAEADPDARNQKDQVELSRYIRKCIFSSSGFGRDMEQELRELKFQIRKIGVNINQAVHRINAGYAFPDDDTLLLTRLAALEQLFNDFLKKMEEETVHGHHKTDAHEGRENQSRCSSEKFY